MPNEALRALLAEAGWSGAELARRVNGVAAEAGLARLSDRQAASFWLAGRCPRAPVPELVAEAMSRGLGRHVDVADVGMGKRRRTAAAGTGSGLGSTGVRAHNGLNRKAAEPQDAVTSLSQLALPHGRRQILAGGAYSLSLLAVPAWAQAAARGGQVTRPRLVRGAGPVTAGRLDAAEQMAWLFTGDDSAFGGGYARGALAAYLAHDIAPLLRAPAAPALRTRLLSVAAQLAYRCGFTCFDDEQQGLAQRYYRTALDLAAQAGDPVAYAITLRAMSVQAYSLGHRQHAVQLAEAAAATSQRKLTPMRQAFLLGQVAVAVAASQDRAAALSALSAAERRVDQATSGTSPRPAAGAPALPAAQELIGDYHLAALSHQQAEVRALLGDRAGAITALQDSLSYRPPGERRSRAIITARLAEFHITEGHLDQAVRTWHAFLGDYPYLRSGRVSTALRVMRSRLRPYAANPGARDLLARAAAL